MKMRNKDIAKMLGISVTSVSLAINNRPGVSEETREKVLSIIRNHVAGSQDLAQRGTLLLSVHKKHGNVITDKPFFSDLIETVQQEAMNNSYSLSIVHYLPGQDLNKFRDYLAAQPNDGMIVMATEMLEEDLAVYQSLNKPLVLLDGSFDLAEVDSIALDNQTAIYRAFAYAVSKGHKDIGYLRSNVFINNFGHHFDGFIKGIREFELDGFFHPVIDLPCNVEGAYNSMKGYLQENKRDLRLPTLFLADLDYIALGAMRAVKEAGYEVPNDISFIGYDDIALCEISDPPLTTSRVNRHDVGKLAVTRLMQIIDQPAEYYVTTQVSSSLIVRGSVKSMI